MVNGKKLLAMLLVFTMTFSYFAIVNEVLATTSFVSLFGGNAGTGNENVEFEAYLADGERTADALMSDVNNENLAIKLQLAVKESGYLKNGKVEFKAKEEELNFVVKEDNNIAELEQVQSLQENVLEFNKIERSSEKLEISIPITYEMEEYIKEEKLNGTTQVIFSGTYVNEKGKEKEVSKEVELTLAWQNEKIAKIENEVSKYIQFGEDGVILQTIVKVNTSTENQNSLPTKATELTINVPKMADKTPTEVSVIANSTAGTNGKGVGEVEFTEENWNYDAEQGIVKINLENKKQWVDVDASQEYLKIDGEQKEQEERYYSNNGTDEYVLTYTFQEVAFAEEMKTSSSIEAKVATFSGVEAQNNETVTTAEEINDIILNGQTGNIISYNIENETPEVSKIHAYLNKEVEYNSKTAINVSYTDIVEEMIIEDVENKYIDKAGNELSTEDLYYKQILVNQENFKNILGEEGSLRITDVAGNELAMLNKEATVDENGNYVVDFQNRVSKVIIQTSAPVNTGNLIVSNKKATSELSISKAEYASMDYLATTTRQKAKFTYVSEIVDLGNAITKTKLKDTKTDINLVLDKDSLSTATTNNNVEMRLELNNNQEISDPYGNSIFEIEMPEYVTGLNVTNANMIYGEGLEIANVETLVRNGKMIVRISVSGKQMDLNSGVLTNGTNIVLNADITVDMYAPSMEATIKAYAYNSEATNYANPVEYTIGETTTATYQEAKVQYIAPSGMIAINTTFNYDSKGSSLTSMKQGKQVDYIDIYSPAKVATMEIAMMNNNEKAVSNVAILGRIPFKGVKDFGTNDDLGSTIDTKMISGIASNTSNQGEFIVYYSENGQATKDLNDTANNWELNPVNFEKVKSYLIVPKDGAYQFGAKQVLKFTYEYEIPENLTHNQAIYGTFLASYSNENIEETVQSDLIGLTTGAGPELEIKLVADKQTAKENDEIKLTATVKNVGKDVAQEVKVKLPVPTNTIFVSAEADRDGATIQSEGANVVANLGNLAKGSTAEINAILKVGIVNSQESIGAVASVEAKDLKTALKSEEVTIQLITAEIRVKQAINNTMSENYYYTKDDKLTIMIMIQNLTQEAQENVKLVTNIPNELNIIGVREVIGFSENDVPYNPSSNEITWDIGRIEGESGKQLNIRVAVGDLRSGMTADTVYVTTQVSGNGIETIKAKDIKINIGKNSLSISQTSSTSTYVTEGEMIDYTFTIKNEGTTDANNIILTDIIPDGIIVKEMSYASGGDTMTVKMSDTETSQLTVAIPKNDQIPVNVTALADELESEKEKTVTNVGTVSSTNIDEIRSNSVTHIIQERKSSSQTGNNNNTNQNNNHYTNQDITKSYKISGIAWLDANKNGMRDDGEQRMSNITAMLVDSTSGVIKATTTTDSNGEYFFNGLSNGTYLVLFKYDTTVYTTTTYRKEGVEAINNSDAVTTKIEQNGKQENGAVTDIITLNGANMTNIDIGLIETTKFSLGIDKAITKVTVQNAKGTVTKEFDKAKLTQYGITAKYLSGTTAYVEYTITVTNNGDLEGFASEIVDYIPEGMTFNSGLNPDWYTGTDGNLYTKALADTELKAGQSKEITLVLTKQMTTENTGMVSNMAEIASDYNVYGVSDINSTPGNKAQGEDDISTADIILTVKTGETIIYITAIIICTIAGAVAGFMIYERKLKNKSEGGV